MGFYNVINAGSMVSGQPEDISQVVANLNAIASVLNGNLDNTNMNAAAGISRSKLDFGVGLVNADIAPAAAVVGSKLADGTVPLAKLIAAASQYYLLCGDDTWHQLGFAAWTGTFTGLVADTNFRQFTPASYTQLADTMGTLISSNGKFTPPVGLWLLFAYLSLGTTNTQAAFRFLHQDGSFAGGLGGLSFVKGGDASHPLSMTMFGLRNQTVASQTIEVAGYSSAGGTVSLTVAMLKLPF